jgi:UDP-glucuronate decarboxylase
VARIFNTYGPRMDHADGRVVSNFIMPALPGEPITLFGDGSQTWSFCYVDDLLSGLVALMESSPYVTGPVNLGNSSEFTIRELAEKVIRLIGSRLDLVLRALPQDDPRQRRPDIRLAAKLLDCAPVIALDDGLTRSIPHFKQRVAELAAAEQPARPYSALFLPRPEGTDR